MTMNAVGNAEYHKIALHLQVFAGLSLTLAAGGQKDALLCDGWCANDGIGDIAAVGLTIVAAQD